eukprot:2413787-Rhodomonas_salina.1
MARRDARRLPCRMEARNVQATQALGYTWNLRGLHLGTGISRMGVLRYGTDMARSAVPKLALITCDAGCYKGGACCSARDRSCGVRVVERGGRKGGGGGGGVRRGRKRMVVVICYVMSGTDLSYGRSWSGTDLAYGATRKTLLRQRTLQCWLAFMNSRAYTLVPAGHLEKGPVHLHFEYLETYTFGHLKTVPACFEGCEYSEIFFWGGVRAGGTFTGARIVPEASTSKLLGRLVGIAIVLRMCYAMSGGVKRGSKRAGGMGRRGSEGECYAATRCPAAAVAGYRGYNGGVERVPKRHQGSQAYTFLLGMCYAMSGTDCGYAATRRVCARAEALWDERRRREEDPGLWEFEILDEAMLTWVEATAVAAAERRDQRLMAWFVSISSSRSISDYIIHLSLIARIILSHPHGSSSVIGSFSVILTDHPQSSSRYRSAPRADDNVRPGQGAHGIPLRAISSDRNVRQQVEGAVQNRSVCAAKSNGRNRIGRTSAVVLASGMIWCYEHAGTDLKFYATNTLVLTSDCMLPARCVRAIRDRAQARGLRRKIGG